MTDTTSSPTMQQVLPPPTTRVRVSTGDELEVWVLGTGTPAVLVHGAAVRDMLLPLADQLTRRGYQVIHLARRGHGGHGLPAEAVDVAGQAGDVVAVLDELGLARAHVVGHSFGASIALEVALRAPDRVLSVCLLDLLLGQALSPAAQEESRQFAEVGLAAVGQMYAGGETDRAVMTFLDLTAGVDGAWDLVGPRLPEDARRLAAVDLETFLRVDGPAMFSYGVDPAPVPEMSTPVVWVGGGASVPAFHETRAFLEDRLPGITAATLDGVGHFFPVVRAAEAAAVLDEAIGSTG